MTMRISLPREFRWPGTEYAAVDSDARANSRFARRGGFDD